MDPARWSNDDMTELERQLLEAARSDRVPEALSARMAQALQIGGAALSTSSAAAQVGIPLLANKGLWGALSLGMVAITAGWYATLPTPAQQRATSAPQQVTQAPPSPAVERPREPTPVPSESSLDPRTPTDNASAAPAVKTVNVDDDALRAEVALLAQVRGALQRRETARALRLLDRHQQRFANGTLVPEAGALRIEALIQRGAHAQAEAQAAQFVQRYPAHPLRTHVADLVASGAGSAAAASGSAPR